MTNTTRPAEEAGGNQAGAIKVWSCKAETQKVRDGTGPGLCARHCGAGDCVSSMVGQPAGIREEVAAGLCAAIDRAGLRRKDVAQTLGITEAALSIKLSGRTNLTLESIAEIADAAGATFRWEFAAPGAAAAATDATALPASLPGAAEHLANTLEYLATKCRPGYMVSKAVRDQIKDCHAIATCMHAAHKRAAQAQRAVPPSEVVAGADAVARGLWTEEERNDFVLRHRERQLAANLQRDAK